LYGKTHSALTASLGVNRIAHPAQCRLGMMPARGHQPGRQIGLPAEGDSRWDAIWQLILQAEQLPAQERAAFVMRHYHECSIDEISRTLDLQTSAAKHAVFRAVRKMRAALRPLVANPE